MRVISIKSLKNQAVIADQCVVAERHWDRGRGLIGTKEFKAGKGMYFPRCKSITTWFMSIPIDVVFVRVMDANRVVVTSVFKSVKPWKFFPTNDWSAGDVIELPVGTIETKQIVPGDELCIS